MTRGTRTLLFMLGATLANILVAGIVFVGLLLLYGLTLGRVLKAGAAGPVILVAFLLSIVASAFIYKKALDWARKKWNLEEKLGFGGKGRRS
jgi:hypothetical protein